MQTAVKRLLRQAYPLYRPLVSSLGLIDVMARKHLSDKRVHGYLKHYRQHFGPLRHSTHKLFEIGVGGYQTRSGGESLRMWKDYFPKAEIFGMDIADKSHLQEPNIRIFQGDQNDPVFLDELASRWGPFDIIIDDGSHVSEHIITSFKALFPHLAPNGLYVIEDLNLSYDDSVGGSSVDLDSPGTSLGMLKTLVDDMHWKYIPGRTPQNYGDRITGITFYPKICFIQKGDNTARDLYVESWKFDLRAVSWGDGTGVPTSDSSLVIVGVDNKGLVHIRIFDAGGKRVADTDETKIPGEQAGEVSALKQLLSGLLSPHVLTDGEKRQLMSKVTSIVLKCDNTARDLRVEPWYTEAHAD